MKSRYLLFGAAGVLVGLVFFMFHQWGQDPKKSTSSIKSPGPLIEKTTLQSVQPAGEVKPTEKVSVEALKKTDWWATVQRKIRHREYHLQRAPQASTGVNTYSAPNRSQNFRATFTPQGLQLANRTEAETPWQAELFAMGWGRGEYVIDLPLDFEPSVDENKITFDRGSVMEWYENRSEGLEQGFTVKENLPGDGPLELLIKVAGNIRPVFQFPEKVIEFISESNERILRCGQLIVTDAKQQLLTSHFDLVENIIKIVIDDSSAVYPITVDPLFSDPVWTAVGEQDEAYFGYSVSTAGDVNGDGFSDVIIGAPKYDVGQFDEGAAFLFYGSPTGPSPFISWMGTGGQASSFYGGSISIAGDVNNDGYSDVAVGAYRFVNTPNANGRVFIYHGSDQGLSQAANLILTNNTTDNEHFGISVSPAGDVNGDSYSDIIIGADGNFEGRDTPGRAYVYYGSATGIDPADYWEAGQGNSGDGFGNTVGTAGDVNGDGFSDVIIGAPFFDYTTMTYLEDVGRVYVYHGSSDGLPAEPDWTARSNLSSSNMGGGSGTYDGYFPYLVDGATTAGDVNGDGFSDIIVSCYSYTNPESNEGAVFVYYGSTTGLDQNGTRPEGYPANADWSAEGNEMWSRMGSSVGPAGDVNGDGYADIVVSADVLDKTYTGKVLVYYGSATGLNRNNTRPSGNLDNADWRRDANIVGGFFGYSVKTAGDVNGDGFSDLIVGESRFKTLFDNEGRAYVFLGASKGLTFSGPTQPDIAGGEQQAYLGMALASAGDVNGDGFEDVIVAAPAANTLGPNEVLVYYGTENGLGTTPDWTAQSGRCAGFYGCDEFGRSVGSAGDVNGDGYDDIIVGTLEKHIDDVNFPGIAIVYHGSPAGLNNTGDRPIGDLDNADWIVGVPGGQEGTYFGVSVSKAGDVNGDGYGDVIVGAPYYDNGEIDEGRVFVYHGSSAGLSDTPSWSAESNQARATFGIPVSIAGDVNGDGFSDVLVGASFFDNGEINEGRVFVFHGGSAGLNQDPAWVAESDTEFAYFGWAASTAGDVNGDGFSDVVVGAYGDDQFTGKAFVYHGGQTGLNTEPNWTFLGTAPNDHFGRMVNTAGDVNGDGYSDVVIGAPERAPTGYVYVFKGSPAGLDSNDTGSPGPDDEDIFIASGDLAEDHWFGLAAAAADANGDGYADLVVGSPEYNGDYGAVYFYYGNEGDVVYEKPRQFRASDARPVAHLGKSDSETAFNIQMLGRSPLGRGMVGLEWEVKPAGVPFDGQGTVVGQGAFVGDDWYNSGVDGEIMQAAVEALTGHTAYHWRARIRYPAGNPLGNVAGPWMVPFPGGLDISAIRTDNNAPTGGYDVANVIPTNSDQIVQATDGSGVVTIGFRINDPGTNLCILHAFMFSINDGTDWIIPAEGDDSPALGGGWPDNHGAYYGSMPDWSGEIHTFTFNTKLMPELQNVDSSTVRIRFGVNDGQLDSLQATVSESFRVDNAYPTGTIDIVGGTYTSDSTPAIIISGAPGDTTRMRFALQDEGYLADAAWEPYAPSYQGLDIGPENGPKVVYAELRDAFGNVQPAATAYPQDDIIFDTEPPLEGSLIIADSQGFTNTGVIQLNVGVFDQLCPTTDIGMEFAVNGVRAGVWHDYASSYSFDFCQGGCPAEGEVVIEVRFRDAAGNVSDIAANDVTVYDVTLNPSFFNIESDYCPASICHIANPSPILISEVEGADFMQFALSQGELASKPLWPYANVHYTEGLLSGQSDGAVTIFARYSDSAGNTGERSTTIVLDTQPPGAAVTETDQWASGSAIEVDFDIDAGDADPSGVAATSMYYKRTWNTFWKEASLAGVSSPLNFTDLSGDGYYYFWVSSEDHVGNSDGNPPTLAGPEPPFPPGVYRVLYETAKPSSHVEQIAYDDVNTRFDIIYNYNDSGGTPASGVDKVELYVKEPGQSTFPVNPVATDADTSIDGVFTYDLAGKDAGVYLFYTIATDKAGNVEGVPVNGFDRQAIFSDEFAGYAILAVGSISGSEGIEAHTLTANNVYKHLINRNFALVDDDPEQDPFDHIKYFNPYFDPQTGEDDYSSGGTVSYWTALKNAITVWALEKQKVRSGPLYIILIDHGTSDGSTDKFYLNGTEYITPNNLDQWVGELEDDLMAEDIFEDIVIVLGYCFSGSFVDELAQEPIPDNPADPQQYLRRVIVASAAYNEPSYRGPMEPGGVRDGEYFISTLFSQWARDRWDEDKQPVPGYVPMDLKRAYKRAVQLTEIHTDSGLVNAPAPYYDTAMQHPYMDDNGVNDGTGTVNRGSHELLPGGDGEEAAYVGFGFATELLDLVEIVDSGKEPETPLPSSSSSALLWVKVDAYDPNDVIWAEIRDPGTTLSGGTTQQTVDLTEVSMTWDAGDSRYEATYTGFVDPGRYTVFFYTKDSEGLVSSFEKTYVYKESSLANTAPEAPILQQPQDNSSINASAGISFGWTIASDPEDDAVTYTIEIQQIEAAQTSCPGNCFYYKEEGLNKAAVIIDPDPRYNDPGDYTWQVTAVDAYGAETSSSLRSFSIDNKNLTPGWIDGYVIDADTKQPIAAAQIQTTLAVSLPGNGYYLGYGQPGTYAFAVSAAGYESRNFTNISILEGDLVNQDLELTPLAQQVATPAFSPTPQSYNTPQSVSIACTTSGATIYYTTDGTDPTESSTAYSAAIAISTDTTIKARAYYSSYAPSVIVTGAYAITVDDGDVNWDGNVTVSDAVLALQVMMGAEPAGVDADADVDGDGKVGLAEVVFILQETAGLRD